jgi:hypothetical protein
MTRRTKPHTFDQNIEAERDRLLLQLESTVPGPLRELIVSKLRQLETAALVHEPVTSPGLQPPSK